MGAYLETLDTLRDRQSRLNEIEHTLREQAPVTNDKYTSAVETDRLDAQFDLGRGRVDLWADQCPDDFVGGGHSRL